MTTFLTLFGRFCYMRLPFGIRSRPECFQDKINGIHEGLQNVNCQMDDIIVDSDLVENHEEVLFPILSRLEDSGVTANQDKCEFLKESIVFVGQRVGANGISPDDSKVAAVREM